MNKTLSLLLIIACVLVSALAVPTLRSFHRFPRYQLHEEDSNYDDEQGIIDIDVNNKGWKAAYNGKNLQVDVSKEKGQKLQYHVHWSKSLEEAEDLMEEVYEDVEQLYAEQGVCMCIRAPCPC